MEYSEIKKIMKDMEESNLAELSIEFPDGTKVSVKNKVTEFENVPQKRVSYESREVVKEVTADNEREIKKPEENLQVVTSPMVGTFYSKPSPNAENYVEVGKKVKKGDILCIIEAMKLMNEIESEYDGEIAEILVKDGEMVDFGKPLFKIK